MECKHASLVHNQSLTSHPRLAWTNSIKKYGMTGSAYSSNGYKTCGGYPGAYQVPGDLGIQYRFKHIPPN
jgi:hypothetical protein